MKTAKQWHRLNQINEKEKTAICSVCGPTKLFSNGKTKIGIKWKCSIVHNLAAKERYKCRCKPKNYRKHILNYCERCKFIPEDLVQLQVHHIDRNRKNNTLENLKTLCANCHVLAHGNSFLYKKQVCIKKLSGADGWTLH